MWSCIYRNSFGYGWVPASSAPVEGEMNKLKNVDFVFELGNLRVDRILQEHVANLNGKMLLVDAKMPIQIEKTDDVEEEVERPENDIQERVVGEEKSAAGESDDFKTPTVERELFIKDRIFNVSHERNKNAKNASDPFYDKDFESSPTVRTESNEDPSCTNRIQENKAAENTCIACANGHEPTGAHTCAVCNKVLFHWSIHVKVMEKKNLP